MEEFRKAKSVALYDAGIMIFNTYPNEEDNRDYYTHPFHNTDLGAYSLEGFDLAKILAHFGIDLTEEKYASESYKIYRDLVEFGSHELGAEMIPLELEVKVTPPNFLDLHIKVIKDGKEEDEIKMSYSGKFSIVWK